MRRYGGCYVGDNVGGGFSCLLVWGCWWCMNGGVCGVGWSSGFGVMVVKLWELEV